MVRQTVRTRRVGHAIYVLEPFQVGRLNAFPIIFEASSTLWAPVTNPLVPVANIGRVVSIDHKGTTLGAMNADRVIRSSCLNCKSIGGNVNIVLVHIVIVVYIPLEEKRARKCKGLQIERRKDDSIEKGFHDNKTKI